MNIVSVNISQPVDITWRGKKTTTGIFKEPVHSPIALGEEDVAGDSVIDRKHHGGRDKACYIYSADLYPHWKNLYPGLPWNWGMFGENITVNGFNETEIHIGDTFQIGNAVVQISQPRQPCYKLGVRFKNQKVLKDFILFGHPGAYVRVLTPGSVTHGDSLKMLQPDPECINLQTVFQQLYSGDDEEFIKKAIEHPHLASSCKRDLERKLK